MEKPTYLDDVALSFIPMEIKLKYGLAKAREEKLPYEIRPFKHLPQEILKVRVDLKVKRMEAGWPVGRAFKLSIHTDFICSKLSRNQAERIAKQDGLWVEKYLGIEYYY